MKMFPTIVSFFRSFRRLPAPGVAVYNLCSFGALVFVSYLMLAKVREEDDLMFSSGILATIAALLVGVLTDGSTRQLLGKMQKAGLVQTAPRFLSDFGREHILSNIRWHIAFVPILTLPTLGYILIERDLGDDWPYFLGYMLTSVRFGRVAANGALAAYLNKKKVKLHLRLGHKDGACGLAFVGDFFLRQIAGLIIPIIWLVFWLGSIVIDRFSYDNYGHWWPAFVVLSGIVAFLAVVGFARPMKFGFGEMMKAWTNDSRTQMHEMFRMGRQHYAYEIAVMPTVPISPDAVRTALLGIVFPMALAAASALVALGAGQRLSIQIGQVTLP